MKKVIFAMVLLLVASVAVAQETWQSATARGVEKPVGNRVYNLFRGPMGLQSPLWLGSAPTGTSTDAWIYNTGTPSGFEYFMYSTSSLPTYLSGDLTVAPSATGGDNFNKNQISGLFKLTLVSLAAGTNGTTETTLYTDDTPAGEWTALDADVVVSNSTTHVRVGSNALKLAFAATAIAGDGVESDITNDNLESNESIGFWIYSDTALTAGWLTLVIDDTDAAPDLALNVPAVTAGAWQWVEIDISALAAGNGDVVDKIAFKLSTAGATGLAVFNVWIDTMYKWDATDEDILGDSVMYDGVLSVLSLDTANTGTHTFGNVSEHTDYFVNYQSGNEVLVWITDQSAKSLICMYAY